MKRKTIQRVLLAFAALATVAALPGCWDSNDDDGGVAAPGDTEPRVPQSAGASVGAYIAFLKTLGADETSAPLSLEGFTPPVDETSEPVAIP